MSSNELVKQIMAQVIARVATPEHEVLPKTTHQIRETVMAEKSCTLTEFVGTAIGDTVGLVIANVDSALLDAMKLEKRYRSIGILGARIGAGPHIMAADEAVIGGSPIPAKTACKARAALLRIAITSSSRTGRRPPSTFRSR
ncbi:propanediol utilization protein:polyhedral bodies [Escherichia coli]|nr:propanediol utilization protein:polyhedral bodies [Escherichia coli]